jgi:hypothetical protein
MALVLCAVLFSGCKTTLAASEPSDKVLKNTELTPEGITRFIEHRNQSRGLEDKTNYQQAFDGDLANAQVSMRMLNNLCPPPDERIVFAPASGSQNQGATNMRLCGTTPLLWAWVGEFFWHFSANAVSHEAGRES